MPRTLFQRFVPAGMAVILLAAPGRAAGLGRLLRPQPRERERVANLARRAMARDPEVAWKAIQALRDRGEPARGRLTGVLRRLLERGREVVQRASRMVADPARVADLQKKLNRTRAAARANVTALKKGPSLQKAHEYYKRLDEMMELLDKVFEVREAVRLAMVQRRRILPLWRSLDVEDLRFSRAREADLAETAESILGLSTEAVCAIPEFGKGDPPERGSTSWHYWYYAACREVEAYNESLRDLMSSSEYANVRAVNHYRELLGILPMEVDPRLLQAARRHSKEMADLGYFGHDSPKADHKTVSMRVRQAGYPAGASENCADGYATGKAAFWGWFDSPGHHRNMVAERNTAFGVGRWGRKWTQNFGGAGRLMLTDAPARRQVAVKGEVLPPRG